MSARTKKEVTLLDNEITARFDPEGDSIVFVKEENDDERHQLFRYELLTGRIRLMTDGKSLELVRRWIDAVNEITRWQAIYAYYRLI